MENNIENLILQERERKNALNRASYMRRKDAGNNKAIIPIDQQMKRGRKSKPINDELIKNYIPPKARGRPRQIININ